ncbi:MAG: phosphotransferase [Caldilineaceae bacterium]|nr:phosphotransferase [Caldilineaceae bacterium]
MSDTEKPDKPPWVSHLHIVLPDRAQRRVWLLPGENGWALPALDVEGGVWVGDAARLIPLLRKRLGLIGDFTILRHLGLTDNNEARWDRAYPVVEFQQQVDEPLPDGRWVDGDELSELSLADESQHGLLSAFLAESEPPPLRATWARPGWFAQAADWMAETLAALGRTPTGPVEQVKILGISCLLRQPSDAGTVYFKATARLPLFVNEGRLMEALARHFPRWIPAPLARNDGNSWMLLDDFGPNLWERDKKNADFAPAAAEYARLQQASAERVEELLALGCFDRRLPVLAEQIDALLTHPLTSTHARSDELSQLATLAPRLRERCAQLAGFGLPDALVHGDLHLGNLAARGDGYLFFDWSDACVAHPFLDMITPYFLEKDETKRVRGKEAYLAAWGGRASRSALENAWTLAKPLAALHQAVSYLHILIGQEEVVHPEMASGLRDFVSFAVKAMDEI